MRVVLLLSGGVESSTLLRLEARTHEVVPIFLDYAQRAAAQEWIAAQAQCGQLAVRPPVRLDLARVGETFRAGQEKKYHVPLPHRNVVALSLALSYAVQGSAQAIAIAVTADDDLAYASASANFIAHFRSICLMLDGVDIRTPLANLHKHEVVRHGVQLGVDFSTTYSCLLGYARHCGRCPQCAKRKAAFEIAEIAEPADFYSAPLAKRND